MRSVCTSPARQPTRPSMGISDELKIILRWTNCNRTSKTTNSQPNSVHTPKDQIRSPENPFPTTFARSFVRHSHEHNDDTRLFGHPVEFSNKYFDKVRPGLQMYRWISLDLYLVCTHRFGKVIRWHTSYLLGMKMRCPLYWMGFCSAKRCWGGDRSLYGRNGDLGNVNMYRGGSDAQPTHPPSPRTATHSIQPFSCNMNALPIS